MRHNQNLFVVRMVQMWCIANEDLLGIVQNVQTEESYMKGCATDAPLSQQIKKELPLNKDSSTYIVRLTI